MTLYHRVAPVLSTSWRFLSQCFQQRLTSEVAKVQVEIHQHMLMRCYDGNHMSWILFLGVIVPEKRTATKGVYDAHVCRMI